MSIDTHLMQQTVAAGVIDQLRDGETFCMEIAPEDTTEVQQYLNSYGMAYPQAIITCEDNLDNLIADLIELSGRGGAQQVLIIQPANMLQDDVSAIVSTTLAYGVSVLIMSDFISDFMDCDD